jgi:hypothetical protein
MKKAQSSLKPGVKTIKAMLQYHLTMCVRKVLKQQSNHGIEVAMIDHRSYSWYCRIWANQDFTFEVFKVLTRHPDASMNSLLKHVNAKEKKAVKRILTKYIDPKTNGQLLEFKLPPEKRNLKNRIDSAEAKRLGLTGKIIPFPSKPNKKFQVVSHGFAESIKFAEQL